MGGFARFKHPTSPNPWLGRASPFSCWSKKRDEKKTSRGRVPFGDPGAGPTLRRPVRTGHPWPAKPQIASMRFDPLRVSPPPAQPRGFNRRHARSAWHKRIFDARISYPLACCRGAPLAQVRNCLDGNFRFGSARMHCPNRPRSVQARREARRASMPGVCFFGSVSLHKQRNEPGVPKGRRISF